MRKKHNEDYWIALSDIMTALMLLFLLISVVYMIKVEDSVKIPQIFKQTTQGLDEKLRNERLLYEQQKAMEEYKKEKKRKPEEIIDEIDL